ncbi:hypothetical protein [Marixanthomonas spongiae]|uniref:Uncharacterized protein n=1 Tax=Marixanthomonas spongiae TaxID=2174845 RepID=A0A2U0I831_9FLAO|nr:hypothetical protein [Marixanthomonas spongiae]PVW17259.1 hypothetical protein DDV96_01750 [Marixanthomonas spongiae]
MKPQPFKKYIVIFILFALPITAYVFFASGVNNFAKLPTLTPSVHGLEKFTLQDGSPVQLKDNITVLGFFGKNPLQQKVGAYNLAHKIYKKNHEFKDFQIVFLLPEEAEQTSQELKQRLAEIAATDQWKFAFGPSEEIKNVFSSLESNFSLDENLATPYVFIIDKDQNLRGRKDDEDVGVLYGYDSREIAEINNKMSDDIKVVLAEYRLALKKNNAKREI